MKKLLFVLFLFLSVQSHAAKMSSYTNNTTPNSDVYFIGVDPNDTTQTVNGSNYRYSLGSVFGLGLLDADFNSLTVSGAGDSWLELNNNTSFTDSLTGKYGLRFYNGSLQQIINGTASAITGGTGGYVTAPTYSDQTGTVGQWSFDASYIYICEAENQWDRFPVTFESWNNPTPTAPVMDSATLAADGETLTLVFDQAVTQGTGYADTDIDVDASVTGNNISVTYSSGDGTDTHIYTLGSVVNSGETVDLDFNGDADSLENGTGDDLAAIVSGAVTNNSAQGGECITPESGNLFNEGFEGTGYETSSGITAVGTVAPDTARPGADPGYLCDSSMLVSDTAGNYIRYDNTSGVDEIYARIYIYPNPDELNSEGATIFIAGNTADVYDRCAQINMDTTTELGVIAEGATSTSEIALNEDAWNTIDLHIVRNGASTMSVNGGAAQNFTARDYTMRYTSVGLVYGDALEGDFYFDRIHVSTSVIP